ncbi:hypothetical protein Theam_1808 (plasmid) [Thermovibrio ammonificans HB-1]|uniref:Uncharacterized protein n=1 Tax=Thermovibrio ammonificans (strain DSM 15698 / JCM 12110 / HB-1) TaxID=648996 RepID=E8T6U1_THEA1|nr:hypothetical protein [Thermovibrio ammonificans]ADU97764.1 hypothetical protein Theam_1808 [Thermovibrio ammonificans HB-1]
MGVRVKVRKTKLEVVRGDFSGREATVDYAVGLSIYSLFSVLTGGRPVDLDFCLSDQETAEFCDKLKRELLDFRKKVDRVSFVEGGER